MKLTNKKSGKTYTFKKQLPKTKKKFKKLSNPRRMA